MYQLSGEHARWTCPVIISDNLTWFCAVIKSEFLTKPVDNSDTGLYMMKSLEFLLYQELDRLFDEEK